MDVVNAQQAYEAETQQMLQTWRAETKPRLIQACEAAADRRHCWCNLEIAECSCSMIIEVPRNLRGRGMSEDVLKQPLQELLVELGFPEGEVYRPSLGCNYFMIRVKIRVKWRPEDATCTESPPQTTRGTCATCPICHEHRPVVVLVPCGHVICRDCHRCQQLRQCPMCRGPITSATNGLFMD